MLVHSSQLNPARRGSHDSLAEDELNRVIRMLSRAYFRRRQDHGGADIDVERGECFQESHAQGCFNVGRVDWKRAGARTAPKIAAKTSEWCSASVHPGPNHDDANAQGGRPGQRGHIQKGLDRGDICESIDRVRRWQEENGDVSNHEREEEGEKAFRVHIASLLRKLGTPLHILEQIYADNILCNIDEIDMEPVYTGASVEDFSAWLTNSLETVGFKFKSERGGLGFQVRENVRACVRVVEQLWSGMPTKFHNNDGRFKHPLCYLWSQLSSDPSHNRSRIHRVGVSPAHMQCSILAAGTRARGKLAFVHASLFIVIVIVVVGHCCFDVVFAWTGSQRKISARRTSTGTSLSSALGKRHRRQASNWMTCCSRSANIQHVVWITPKF